MLVYVRADASLQIGTGHVMRCLALADELRKQGAEVRFLCRDHEGNLVDYLKEKGYQAFLLQSESGCPSDSSSGQPPHAHWLGVSWQMDAEQTVAQLQAAEKSVDWLIVDHYALDERYETRVRPYVDQVMVIDDLADRTHNSDVLLDQNFYCEKAGRYERLVPAGSRILMGPAYALLREEFRKAKLSAASRDGHVRTLLISFGGVDLTQETMKTLTAVEPLVRQGLRVEVILGKMNPNASSILSFCRQMPNCTVYKHVERVTELMARADLAVGSGGTTTWERCCLGLPSIVITTALNQEQFIEQTAQTEAIVYLGPSSSVTSRVIYDQVQRMMNSRRLCLDISSRASLLVDGLGTQRVIKELKQQ
jgi:UDP-2,4-diacetamido-2,4,6-trideoxy-beta-L-altropyranose hydrolase